MNKEPIQKETFEYFPAFAASIKAEIEKYGIKAMEARTNHNRERFKKNQNFQLSKAEGRLLNKEARQRIAKRKEDNK